MAKGNAATVKDYLDELPPERREVISAVRKLVKKHLPKGYVEAMGWGMICWQIPLSRYPETYNGQPLGYVALAAQKTNYSLYLMGVYANSAQEKLLKDAYKKAGKKLDMGKSCLRFKRLEDLETDAIGELIASTPPEDYIAKYEANRKKRAGR